MIDPQERDVVRNIYIRRVEKRDGKLVNIDIDKVEMVRTRGRSTTRRSSLPSPHSRSSFRPRRSLGRDRRNQ
jgi:hypothetical protein